MPKQRSNQLYRKIVNKGDNRLDQRAHHRVKQLEINTYDISRSNQQKKNYLAQLLNQNLQQVSKKKSIIQSLRAQANRIPIQHTALCQTISKLNGKHQQLDFQYQQLQGAIQQAKSKKQKNTNLKLKIDEQIEEMKRKQKQNLGQVQILKAQKRRMGQILKQNKVPNVLKKKHEQKNNYNNYKILQSNIHSIQHKLTQLKNKNTSLQSLLQKLSFSYTSKTSQLKQSRQSSALLEQQTQQILIMEKEYQSIMTNNARKIKSIEILKGKIIDWKGVQFLNLEMREVGVYVQKKGYQLQEMQREKDRILITQEEQLKGLQSQITKVQYLVCESTSSREGLQSEVNNISCCLDEMKHKYF